MLDAKVTAQNTMDVTTTNAMGIVETPRHQYYHSSTPAANMNLINNAHLL